MIQNSEKQRLSSQHLAVFLFAEPSAGEGFCRIDMLLADHLLQRTAKTATRMV
jgi:hypothetical protein